MARRWALAVLVLVSAAGAGNAQQSATKGKPKSGLALTPEPLQLKPGDALSGRALVTKPPLVKGAWSWSLETRRHRGVYSAIALSPDASLVATGGVDGTIRFWDTETGKFVRALMGHQLYCYALAFSPDGKILASGGYEAGVRLWDVKSGMPLRFLKDHGAHAALVLWSPDGQQIIAAGGQSGYATLWDVTSGKVLHKADLGRPIRQVAWHPDGRKAALSVVTQPLQIWDLSSGKVDTSIGEADSDFTCSAWSPDGKTIAAGSMTAVTLFDDEGKKLRTLESQGSALTWSADGKRLTASALNASKIRIFDTETGKLTKEFAGGTYWLHYYSDERKLLGGNQHDYLIFEVDTGNKLRSFNVAGTIPPWWSVGRPLVTGLHTAALSLWETGTGKLQRTLDGGKTAIAAFAWSPDGKHIAAAGYDHQVRVFDAATGNLAHTLKGHKGVVSSVAWSADGKHLASGGHDKNVIIWDLVGDKPLHTLGGFPGPVLCVTWAPGAAGLVAGGSGNTLIIWNAKSGQVQHTLTDPGLQAVIAMTWTTGAKQLVGAFNDGRVRLWSVGNGKLTATHDVIGGYPELAKFSMPPADASLIMGKGNATLLLWPVKGNAVVCGPQPMVAQHRSGWTAGSGTLSAVGEDRTARLFDAATGQLRGYYIAEEKQILAVGVDGHYRADGPGLAELLCVVQLDKSQETMTPAQFATRFKWKNVPANVRLTGK